MECAVCQKVTDIKKCSRCKNVYYCSVDHQKEHWLSHKPDCGPFKVVDSEDPDSVKGKYCVANRNFKAGEIILEENAAFYSSWMTFISTCVSCGTYNRDWMLFSSSCSKCGCTVCGPACEKNPVHVKNECQLFSKYKIRNPMRKIFDFDTSMVFAMIRGAALKAQRPKMYNELLKLQHTSASDSFQAYMDATVDRFLAKLKSAIYPHPLDFDDEVYKRIGQITLVNVFRQVVLGLPIIVDGEDSEDEEEIEKYNANMVQRSGRYCVYVKASRFNHSCIPNCTWSIGPAPECQIRLRAAVSIKKGEELTISYAGSQPDMVSFGTHQRRLLLKEDCGVSCECPRCKCPTELGTYSSAVTCATCANTLKAKGETDWNNYGYLLPENPLDDEPDASWKCNVCGEQQKNGTILKIVKDIQSKLQGMLGGANALRHFLTSTKKYRGNRLHPNHWVLHEALSAISKALGPELDEDSPELSVIERHKVWAMHSLNLSDKIFPGLSLNRAHLLLLLGTILRTKLAKFGSTMTEEELTKEYNLFMRSSSQAFQYFMEDFCRPGEQINYLATNVFMNMMDIKAEWGDQVSFEDEIVKQMFDHVNQLKLVKEDE